VARLDPNAKITLVETLDDVLDMRSWLGERRSGGWLGVDVETEGLNLGRDRIRLCQYGDLSRGWAMPWEDWRGAVKDTLPVYDRQIVFHNSTFDLAMLKRDGVTVPEVLVDDTMIMAHLVNPASWIGLKPLAAKLVGKEALMGKDALTDLFHGGGYSWATVPIDHPSYWLYSVMDTMLTVGIAEELWPKVRDDYLRIYEIEMGCIHVLRDARLKGMLVDLEYTERTRAQLMSDMAELRVRIPCDPGKDRQVRDLLEERGQRGPLASWWPFRTDSGEVSVDKDALKFFEPEFPELIPPIRRWREKSKLVGTYLNNILSENVDSVLRPNIKQVGARTSRMSITDPALQTLPRGRIVRDAFIPRDGCRIVLADFSQVEARVFAALADCQPMIDSFVRGEDQHAWVASLAYHHGNQELVTPLQRQISKNVGYANLYGAGIPKIAATASAATDTPVSIATIEDFMSRYNSLFPEIAQFKQEIIGEMHRRYQEEGESYVTTRLGRRLIVDHDKPYVAINYVTQASATSDVLKLKICELDAAGLGPYIRLPIHDEVFMEVPDEDVDDVLETTHRVMPERELYAPCPLDIETDVVMTWGEHYSDDPTKRFHWHDTVT
jgi:DNA polymerase-1